MSVSICRSLTRPRRNHGSALARGRSFAAAAVAAVAVLALGASGRTYLDPSAAAPPTGAVQTVGAIVPTGDTWTERLSDPSAWRGGRYMGHRLPRHPLRIDEHPPARPEYDEDRGHEPFRLRTGFGTRGTYRTLCVRLCDGYFYPISVATTPARFTHDEATCQSSCRSPARLYVYPNPGGEPEQMVSLDGRPYTVLPAAFLFRTRYDASCTCKPHPWEQEALARHRAYADAAAKGKPIPEHAKTVARTERSAPQADAFATSRVLRERPEGAMLLGAEQPAARIERRQAEPPPKTSRSRAGNYGRRNDWQSRAFGGY